LNENSNGLLRQCFPKRMELTSLSDEQVQRATDKLIHRLHKVPNYKAPHEVFFRVDALHQAAASCCTSILYPRRLNIVMKTLQVIPDPISLIESMRAVGYTTETAVADLVDNSISANAQVIKIEYDASYDPFVAILDNGHGMGADEMTNAMRHGSSNPTTTRASHDLGRFGLGLKTASLSQCRKMTLVSKKNGSIHARCWDLDYVHEKNLWVVIVPTHEEQKLLPLYDQLSAQKSGTLVVWQSLDRFMSGSTRLAEAMKSRMTYLHDHLSFVFHRFTRNEDNFPALNISVNGMKLKPVDPFLTDNSFTQPLEGQLINVEGETVKVQPYILPHMSHLNSDQAALAGGKDGLRGNQGFFIYRNRRLVIWGTWFRLVPKEEFYKLTRIKVDIPNSLDALWALDIKKSVAYPPDIIRNRLRDLIPYFANISRSAITYPGRRETENVNFISLWQRTEPSHGSFRYEINTDHPAIRKFTDSLDVHEQKRLQSMLDVLATALPFESIYSDMCSDKRQPITNDALIELISIAKNLKEITGLDLAAIMSIDPIARFPQYHTQIQKEFTE
jgi:hypothetical protein